MEIETSRLILRKQGLKYFLISLLGVFIIVLMYKTVFSGHTTPNFDDNSIAQYEEVMLGGIKQSVLIRGDKSDNPVLLYLHGGPGNPETSFIVPYQKAWEEKFVVVNWDQINSGRSYDKSISQDEVTTDRICKDTLELVQWLKKRFGVKKIYLVAHSYGTYVGMRCIEQSPQDFYAYIGTGQIGNQQENEMILINYGKEHAIDEGNTVAIEELSKLGSLPYAQDEFGEKISVSRKWTTYYGGAIYGKKNLLSMYVRAFLRPEYSLKDFVDYFKGNAMYYTNTAQDLARWELFNANLNEEIPKVDVSVYFIQGENDYITSYEACEKYFEMLEAPYKELFKIEGAAHNAIFEQKEVFANILIEICDKNEGL